MTSYSIQELAREFDITPRTLRFYEAIGLINPSRQGVTRVFSEKDRIRLGRTLCAKRLGFSLEMINEIIDMCDYTGSDHERAPTCICQKIHQYRNILINKISDIKDILIALDDAETRVLATLAARQAAPIAGKAESEL